MHRHGDRCVRSLPVYLYACGPIYPSKGKDKLHTYHTRLLSVGRCPPEHRLTDCLTLSLPKPPQPSPPYSHLPVGAWTLSFSIKWACEYVYVSYFSLW